MKNGSVIQPFGVQFGVAGWNLACYGIHVLKFFVRVVFRLIKLKPFLSPTVPYWLLCRYNASKAMRSFDSKRLSDVRTFLAAYSNVNHDACDFK